jgi:hypothetical protein
MEGNEKQWVIQIGIHSQLCVKLKPAINCRLLVVSTSHATVL